MKHLVLGAAVMALAAGAATQTPVAAQAQPATQKPAATTQKPVTEKPAAATQKPAMDKPVAPAAGGTSLGSVTLRQRVMADGQPLAPGTYQVRLTADEAKPAVGQTPSAERYVEFLRSGKVAGRELATIVSAADVGEIAKGPRPGAGAVRVDLLKGNDYVRVWINRGGTNYIIHMPPAAS